MCPRDGDRLAAQELPRTVSTPIIIVWALASIATFFLSVVRNSREYERAVVKPADSILSGTSSLEGILPGGTFLCNFKVDPARSVTKLF